MNELLWIRVGDAGEYERFDSILDAVEYLNQLSVGLVARWINGGPGVGFESENYHGFDFVSCYWGDENADLVRHLDAGERAAVESSLEEVYI
jgi:hypothetical protein